MVGQVGVSQLLYDPCLPWRWINPPGTFGGLPTRSGYLVRLQGAVYIVSTTPFLLLTSSTGDGRQAGALDAVFRSWTRNSCGGVKRQP